jgi:hypothetical protein
MPGESEKTANTNKNGQGGNPKGRIAPELVRRVAERVYGMLRDDLRLDRERARTGSSLRIGGFRR